LYARTVGHGSPVIVLHGGPDFDHGYLLPELDRWRDRYQLVYYDQRGRGRSAENVRPEAVTLASETNLIRVLSPAPVYAGLVAAANLAAAEARRRDPSVRLMISIQVDVANGRLVGGVGGGLAQDRADFPFIQALGLSSYPYLAGIDDPDEIPLDYYSRLVAGAPLPLYVIEGGWPSTSALGSSPDEQRRYIERQARLLDTAGALAWFQITFTDLDVATLGAGLAPFADLGLVDKSLQPKAALAAWDAVFARPRPR